MDARKIITDAQQQASNEHARQALSQMDDGLKILAEYRFKIYTAHINAGFDPEDALFIATMNPE